MLINRKMGFQSMNNIIPFVFLSVNVTYILFIENKQRYACVYKHFWKDLKKPMCANIVL